MNLSRHKYFNLSSVCIGQLAIFIIICWGMLITPKVAEASVANFSIGSDQYYIDGQLKYMDVIPYVKEGRTYLPLRFAAYAIGLSDQDILWEGNSQTVTLMKGNTRVQVQLGSKTITTNNVSSVMDVAPESSNGRTMLPIRWVAEAFGSRVTWDPATQAVFVYSNDGIKSGSYFGSRSNPIPGNNNLTLPFQTYSFNPVKTVKLQLQRIVSGDEANALVKSENPINNIPDRNQEWRIYVCNLTYVSGLKSDVLAANEIINNQNVYVPGGGALKVYDTATWGDLYRPYSCLNVKLYPGDTSKVVYGVLVDKTSDNPLLQIKYDGGKSSNWIYLK